MLTHEQLCEKLQAARPQADFSEKARAFQRGYTDGLKRRQGFPIWRPHTNHIYAAYSDGWEIGRRQRLGL